MNAEGPTHTLSPSEKAMETFLRESAAFQNPLLGSEIQGMPSLPALKKMAQQMGDDSVDMSAGDIADVGIDMDSNFLKTKDETRKALIKAGHKKLFGYCPGELDGYPSGYTQEYPVVIERVAKSLGITQPYESLQSISGRTILADCLSGWEQLADIEGIKGKRGIIADPLSWPGMKTLADGKSIKTLYAPVIPTHSLGASPEGLEKTLTFAKEKKITPIGIYTIIPSNPTGLTPTPDDLVEMVKIAAKHKIPFMIDAFYAPLHPEGHNTAIPMAYLQEKLTEEELQFLSIAIGTTKIIASGAKTAEIFWFAPKGYENIARTISKRATKEKLDRNAYPIARFALQTYHLHEYGIHKAMGNRYKAIETGRQAIRELCNDLDLPLTIGASYYGITALVKGGKSLIRDEEGRPITDPSKAVNTLATQYGLVGAPGPMFRPEDQAAVLLRLTAASTAEKIARLKQILAQMIDNAERHE